MGFRFRKHYTLEEARALLPVLRPQLIQLQTMRVRLEESDNRIQKLLEEADALGGEPVNTWVGALAGIQSILRDFRLREIEIKDLERGLIDFPAIIGGKEVFLCWELGEDDIEYWHDLDTGYAGREPL